MELQYDISRLTEAVDRFGQPSLLVVGDVMLDEFVWGKVSRISPEAPVPVVEVTHETRLLGGAANVINNIISVGGRAELVGVIGQDRPGRQITELAEAMGVAAKGLVIDPQRPTTIKTRIVAQSQQVVRYDREKKGTLSDEVRRDLFNRIEQLAPQVDGVIISDYGKGVVSAELVDWINHLFPRPNRLVAVDPKIHNFQLYRQATVITPNHHEAAQGAGMEIDSDEALNQAGFKIMERLDCESVLITRGEQGMTLFEQGGHPVRIPTVAREVFDVTGAGDTVIAIFTMGRAAGLTRTEAAILANFAAGIVVGEVGTSAVTAPELKNRVRDGAQGLNGYGRPGKA